jgi:hypothetical protein
MKAKVNKKKSVEKRYVIVRSRDAGCFAGYLVKKSGESTVELKEARRLWYWSGAASLSQMAIDGVSKPTECKFPEATKHHTVIGVCEIIPATEKARLSIAKVENWKA